METECYPVAGSMTVYYSSSESEESDDTVVDELITTAVKRNIDNGVLVTKATPAVYYIGNREIYSYKSSESYLESEGTEARRKNGVGVVIVTLVGIISFFLILFCYKKKESSKKIKSSGESYMNSIDKELEKGTQLHGSAYVDTEKSVKTSKTDKKSRSCTLEKPDDSTAIHQGNSGCCW